MSTTAVGRRYAKGLLQAVLQLQQDGQGPEDVAGELEQLAGVVKRFNGLELLVVNPAIPADQKAAVLVSVAERLDCGPVTRRLVQVLADAERLAQLGEIASAYRRLVDEHQGVIDAEVTTPAPLGEAEMEDLRDKLARATGKTVRLSTKTDPDLLGGLVTRIGDVIYDGSLRHHLSRIHGRMIEG